jgi:hypothetical protein
MYRWWSARAATDTNYPAERISDLQALSAAHLQPGMSARSLLAFDVPADPAGYTLIYEPVPRSDFSLKLAVQE